MNRYFEDLREKMVAAVGRGVSESQAARTFGVVSLSSVKRHVKEADRGEPPAPKERAPDPLRRWTRRLRSSWKRARSGGLFRHPPTAPWLRTRPHGAPGEPFDDPPRHTLPETPGATLSMPDTLRWVIYYETRCSSRVLRAPRWRGAPRRRSRRSARPGRRAGGLAGLRAGPRSPRSFRNPRRL